MPLLEPISPMMHLNNEVLGKDFYLKGEWVGLIQLLKKPAVVVQAKENTDSHSLIDWWGIFVHNGQ